MLKYMQGKAENYYKTELPKLYDMGAWEYPDLLRPGIKFDKIVNKHIAIKGSLEAASTSIAEELAKNGYEDVLWLARRGG